MNHHHPHKSHDTNKCPFKTSGKDYFRETQMDTKGNGFEA